MSYATLEPFEMWQTEQRSKPSTQLPQRKRGPTIGDAPQALGVGRGSFGERDELPHAA